MKFINWQEADKNQAGRRGWEIRTKCAALWGKKKKKILWLHLGVSLWLFSQSRMRHPHGVKAVVPEAKCPTVTTQFYRVWWCLRETEGNDLLSPGKRRSKNTTKSRTVCMSCVLLWAREHTSVAQKKTFWTPLVTFDLKRVSLDINPAHQWNGDNLMGLRLPQQSPQIKLAWVALELGFSLNIKVFLVPKLLQTLKILNKSLHYIKHRLQGVHVKTFPQQRRRLGLFPERKWQQDNTTVRIHPSHPALAPSKAEWMGLQINGGVH